MSTRSIARQGFTLIELMLSLILAAIVGAALIRMSLAQARFMDQQEAWRSARGVSRSGINRLVSDLRGVEASNGLAAAAAGGQDFTVRVPYAFGVLCTTDGTTSLISLLPVDSAMYWAPGYSGFAYRSSAGNYTYVPSAFLPANGAPGLCNTAVPLEVKIFPAINGSPAGQPILLTGAVPPALPVGSIFFLYRTVRYEFKNSLVLPGRTGLFRTMVSGNTTEELAAPFNNTARVNFYVLDATPAQSAVPALLSNVRGLELVLTGMSERTPGGSTGPKSANVTTSVFFENRPD
jgi:prepilin-type N-terminal cleavage/methylation domain-containing protein